MDIKKTKVKWRGLFQKHKIVSSIAKKKELNPDSSEERPDTPDAAFKVFKRLKQLQKQKTQPEPEPEEQVESLSNSIWQKKSWKNI